MRDAAGAAHVLHLGVSVARARHRVGVGRAANRLAGPVARGVVAIGNRRCALRGACETAQVVICEALVQAGDGSAVVGVRVARDAPGGIARERAQRSSRGARSVRISQRVAGDLAVAVVADRSCLGIAPQPARNVAVHVVGDGA